MRHTRSLFLVAILFIVAGFQYAKLKEGQERNTPIHAKLLDVSVSGKASEWTYALLKGGQRVGLVRAKTMRALDNSPVLELDGVSLEVDHRDGIAADRVESAKAQFNTDTRCLAFPQRLVCP